MKRNYTIEKELSVVFGGGAGQGIDTIAVIISNIYKKCGYNVCFTKEYMSRIRGGINSSEIRIAENRVNAYIDTIDLLFVLNPAATEHLKKRITEQTQIIEIDTKEKFQNTHAAGILFGMTGIDISIPEQEFKTYLQNKGEDITNKNLETLKQGYEIGQKSNTQIRMAPSKIVENEMLLTGNDAVSAGCLAGGCNFISSYPMTPGTAVFVQLCEAAEKFGIITEQAEDEISAMNMNIGAWYAGARAIVTTSGGGFDLMTEALSLAGIIESPMVIHIAQRPGPATGLPTKTEQGDLDLALYAGHGDFPRIIYAPGTLEECYELSKQAFFSADKYQIPVFVLTDQYMLDRSYNIPPIEEPNNVIEQHIMKTEKDYKRYKFTNSGISPRGIPGYGGGLVCVDGDEHDEEGRLIEDGDLRVKMVDKRGKKMDLIIKESIPPELTGSPDYKILLIGWGSTKNSIIEAMKLCGRDDIAFLHFKQVYPLPIETKNYLEKAEKVVVIENNTNGQFARLLRIDQTILKYDGMPFSPDKLAAQIRGL